MRKMLYMLMKQYQPTLKPFVNFVQSLMYLHLMRFVQIERMMQFVQMMMIILSSMMLHYFLHNQLSLIHLNLQYTMPLMHVMR